MQQSAALRERGRFAMLLSTIILPPQVTLVSTYAIYSRIGWTGTWLPLLVPHFFANAYTVFLLRQFFMGIPREINEATMIDGANLFRTPISVILPQAKPALPAVSTVRCFSAWNDFFGPLIYLPGKEDLWPISVQRDLFQRTVLPDAALDPGYGDHGAGAAAGDLFFAQRVFMQEVVVTGVDKYAAT